jgi:hypothetical protein
LKVRQEIAQPLEAAPVLDADVQGLAVVDKPTVSSLRLLEVPVVGEEREHAPAALPDQLAGI